MSQTESDKNDTERERVTTAGLALSLFLCGVDIATRKHENSQNTWVLKRAEKELFKLEAMFRTAAAPFRENLAPDLCFALSSLDRRLYTLAGCIRLQDNNRA